VADLFASTAWGDGALGRAVGGRADTVAALSREQVSRFYRRHYRPDNVVVSVAGNVDHDEVVRLVSKAFSFRAAGEAPPRPPRPSTPFQHARPGSRRLHRPFEQVNAVLGFDGTGRGDERRFALGVLTTVLGGGSSSRLFQEVRERRGLAYSVYAFPLHTADSGALCVGLGCLPDKLDPVLDVVRETVGALRRDGVTPEELARGKGQVRGGLVLGLEDSASRMARIGRADLLHGELRSVDETLERIAAVTLDEVHALAGEIFARPEILAVAGPD
jgi:predicted Zn-dependent peptidase